MLEAIIAEYPLTPIILVMINGGSISSPAAFESPSVEGIVEAWYAGEEGGTAVAEVHNRTTIYSCYSAKLNCAVACRCCLVTMYRQVDCP